MGAKENFAKRIQEKYGEEYTVESPYKGKNEKVTFKHTKCGKTTNRTPAAAYKTKRGICQYCTKGVNKDHEWYAYKVEEATNGEYVIIGECLKAKTPVTMYHKICGHKWTTTMDNFIRRESRCPLCAGNAKADTIKFLERLKETYQGEYTTSDEYVNARTKMKIKHETCGNSWYIAPDTLLNQNVGCPVCSESKGEKLVRGILDSMGARYTSQKTFPDCKFTRVLPFDFYIKEYNMCIEYDGIQHFEPTNFGNMTQEEVESVFTKRVKTDKYKTEYCNRKRINLLRVPYYLTEAQVKTLIRSNAEQLKPKDELMI